MGDRSSAVEHHVSAILVAALAVEAQKAGHLTGNEEMEGAIPSDGSPCGGGSIEEHEVASLGIRVRFPAAAPVECSRDYIGQRFERSQEVRALQRAKALASLCDPCRPYRQQRMPVELLFEKERLRHHLSLRFPTLRSSVDAGPHKPECEGSTPSAATNTHAGLVIW